MTLEITEEQAQKELDKVINEQIDILTGHFQRCMLRILNKMFEIDNNASSSPA